LARSCLRRSSTHRAYQRELELCQRYYAKSFETGTQAAQNVGVNTGEFALIAAAAGAAVNRSVAFLYPLTMRIAVTPLLYSPGAASGQAYDETNSLACTSTTVASSSTKSFLINTTGNAGTTVGSRLGIHWDADAEF
jgi:hypothetical protein